MTMATQPLMVQAEQNFTVPYVEAAAPEIYGGIRAMVGSAQLTDGSKSTWSRDRTRRVSRQRVSNAYTYIIYCIFLHIYNYICIYLYIYIHIYI